MANIIAPKLIEHFRPYLGSEVIKNDDYVRKAMLPHIPDFGDNVQIWQNPGPYSLIYYVKVCITENGYSEYADDYIYVGFLQGKVLSELANFERRKADYTIEGVIELRNKLNEAERAYNDAKTALSPFSRY